MNSLKQLIKDRVSLATVTFACAAVLTIPFLTAVTSFNSSLTTITPYAAKSASHVVLTDLSEIDHSIQLQGSLIAQGNSREITELNFTIASAADAKPINLADHSLKISYRDQNQRIKHLTWTAHFQTNYHNQLLGPGEQVQLTIHLSGVLKTHLGPNTPFVIDVTPPQGAILHISRTTPAQLDSTLDLS